MWEKVTSVKLLLSFAKNIDLNMYIWYTKTVGTRKNDLVKNKKDIGKEWTSQWAFWVERGVWLKKV